MPAPIIEDRGADPIAIARSLLDYGRWLEWHHPDAALVARAPDDAKTIQYQWALAMAEGKLDAAEKLVARARGLGISVDNMQRATLTDVHERWWRRGLVVLAAALLFGAVAVLFRRRRPVSTDVATMAG